MPKPNAHQAQVPELLRIGRIPDLRPCDEYSTWLDEDRSDCTRSRTCRACGDIRSERLKGLCVVTLYSPDETRPWPDFTDHPFPVVSKRVVDALRDAGARGFEVFPVALEVKHDADRWGPPPQYFHLQTEVLGLLDAKKCGFRRVRTCRRCGAIQTCPNYPPNGFHFVEGSLPGVDLFTTPWYQGVAFCTRRVYEVAREHQWTGVAFYNACCGEHGHVPHLEPSGTKTRDVPATEIEAPTIRLRTAGPSLADLSKAIGVRAPQALLTLIRIALKEARGSTQRFDSFLQETFGIASLSAEICTLIEETRVEHASNRWPEVPPEVFDFANMGTDCVYYGLVCHAPELDLPDLPVAQVDPTETECAVVSYLGRNMTEALDALMSFELYDLDEDDDAWESDGESEMDHREKLLRQALELHPTPKKAQSMFSLTWRRIPLLASPPPGWKYSRTSDEIGVLAQERHFRPRRRVRPVDEQDELIRLVETDLRDGYPASALVRLREWCWGVPSRGYPKDLAPYLIRAYEALGRPVLAQVCARMSAEFGV